VRQFEGQISFGLGRELELGETMVMSDAKAVVVVERTSWWRRSLRLIASAIARLADR